MTSEAGKACLPHKIVYDQMYDYAVRNTIFFAAVSLLEE